MQENVPYLISSKDLKPQFKNLEKIPLQGENLTLGRAVNNSVVIPFLSISRKHCEFKINGNNWLIEDYSSFGIEVNGKRLGKGNKRKISNTDIIKLEPTEEFVYKFVNGRDETIETPRKKIRLEDASNIVHFNQSDDFVNDVKLKFEASQSSEIKHIEEKILNTKQLQNASMILKQQLHLDMNRKIEQLKKSFSLQMSELKGEKDEVEKQKTLLAIERDAQLSLVKQEMETKISELMTQIKRHNETETGLLNENNLLKKRLEKEREEFLSELNRENSSKQNMLEELERKIKEQEDIRLREKKMLEEILHKETEQLRLAKEKELKELTEQKNLRELEMKKELEIMKKMLQEQTDHIEQQKMKAEQILIEKTEQMKKLSDEEKAKTDQLVQESENIKKKLNEVQANSLKLRDVITKQVAEKESELAAEAAAKIQRQAEQSGEMISTLQEQLEKLKQQLQSAESEKQQLLQTTKNLEDIPRTSKSCSSETKQAALAEVGDIMENELQCSICSELFIEAVTLGCSHTYCKYCITMWKKKKKDCPICRSPIASECRSLVLDTFIEKMVQNLTEEMKQKRTELLEVRQEIESASAQRQRPQTRSQTRGNDSSNESSQSSEISESTSADEENGPSDDFYDDFEYEYELENELNRIIMAAAMSRNANTGNRFNGNYFFIRNRAQSTTYNQWARVAADTRSARQSAWQTVPGRNSSYYGGYGRCYKCGAVGHWAPGCPFT